MRLILMSSILVFSTPAMGHNAASGFKYEAFCCNGDSESGDCQPIRSEDVRPDRDGYQITIGPGDHRLATRQHVFFVQQSKTLESPDGKFHLCLYPSKDTLRCFYAPPMGY
jgi:hypothetical protein